MQFFIFSQAHHIKMEKKTFIANTRDSSYAKNQHLARQRESFLNCNFYFVWVQCNVQRQFCYCPCCTFVFSDQGKHTMHKAISGCRWSKFFNSVPQDSVIQFQKRLFFGCSKRVGRDGVFHFSRNPFVKTGIGNLNATNNLKPCKDIK